MMKIGACMMDHGICALKDDISLWMTNAGIGKMCRNVWSEDTMSEYAGTLAQAAFRSLAKTVFQAFPTCTYSVTREEGNGRALAGDVAAG